jgi:hypothetical protein
MGLEDMQQDDPDRERVLSLILKIHQEKLEARRNAFVRNA